MYIVDEFWKESIGNPPSGKTYKPNSFAMIKNVFVVNYRTIPIDKGSKGFVTS